MKKVANPPTKRAPADAKPAKSSVKVKRTAGEENGASEDVPPKKLMKSASASKLPSTSASVEAAKKMLKTQKKRRQTLTSSVTKKAKADAPVPMEDEEEEPVPAPSKSSAKSNGVNGVQETAEEINPLKRIKR